MDYFHKKTLSKVDIDHHTEHDPHKGLFSLGDVILGGQDGLVNVLGVILGVAAATGDSRILLAAGLAAAFAESVSMGAVAFTATKARHEHYESEQQREFRHIETVPELERQEIKQIYTEKGFAGEMLDQIVDTITANPKVWVSVMMAEEHRLIPMQKHEILRAAFVVGISAIAGSMIPLMPFFFLPINLGIAISLVASAIALFLTGFYKTRTTVGKPLKGGLEMAVIGMASAMVGYMVGFLFRI